MPTLSRLLAVVCLGAALTGCAHPRAETAPVELPPLAMPVPPPRVIAPPEPLPAEPAPEQATAPAPARPRPAPVRPNDRPEKEAARPAEGDKPEASAPADAGARPAEPPPALELASGKRPSSEGAIRALLGRAEGDLGKLDRGALSAERRTQYDTARRFVALAQQALAEQDLVFAANLADKAASLAALLTAR